MIKHNKAILISSGGIGIHAYWNCIRYAATVTIHIHVFFISIWRLRFG